MKVRNYRKNNFSETILNNNFFFNNDMVNI